MANPICFPHLHANCGTDLISKLDFQTIYRNFDFWKICSHICEIRILLKGRYRDLLALHLFLTLKPLFSSAPKEKCLFYHLSKATYVKTIFLDANLNFPFHLQSQLIHHFGRFWDLLHIFFCRFHMYNGLIKFTSL